MPCCSTPSIHLYLLFAVVACNQSRVLPLESVVIQHHTHHPQLSALSITLNNEAPLLPRLPLCSHVQCCRPGRRFNLRNRCCFGVSSFHWTVRPYHPAPDCNLSRLLKATTKVCSRLPWPSRPYRHVGGWTFFPH